MSESPSLEYLTQVDGRLFTTIYCGYHILIFFWNPEWKNYGLTETNMGSERCPRCFLNMIFRGGERRLYWGWLKPNSTQSWRFMTHHGRNIQVILEFILFVLWKCSSSARFIWRQYYGVLFSVFPKSILYQLGGRFKYLFFSFSALFGEDFHFDDHIFQRGWFNHQLESNLFAKCQGAPIGMLLVSSMLQGCHRWRIATN